MQRAALLKLAPAVIGEDARVNHPDCPAGVDRKRRLWVKRTPDAVVAYCHHCGKSYRARLNGRDALDALEPGDDELPDRAYSAEETRRMWDAMQPLDEHNMRNPGSKALLLWLMEKFMPAHVRAALRHTTYAGSHLELRIPIYAEGVLEPTLVGYQTRRFPAAERGPKYVTRRWIRETLPPTVFGYGLLTPWGTAWHGARIIDAPAFIVESFADACSLANMGYSAIPLNGNYAAAIRRVPLIAKRLQACCFRSAVVWLDNDRPDIREGAQDVAEALSLSLPTRAWLDIPAPTHLRADAIAHRVAACRTT